MKFPLLIEQTTVFLCSELYCPATPSVRIERIYYSLLGVKITLKWSYILRTSNHTLIRNHIFLNYIAKNILQFFLGDLPCDAGQEIFLSLNVNALDILECTTSHC